MQNERGKFSTGLKQQQKQQHQLQPTIFLSLPPSPPPLPSHRQRRVLDVIITWNWKTIWFLHFLREVSIRFCKTFLS